MRAWAYIVGYLRVLVSLGLYGWLAFIATVFVGIGAWADWGHIRAFLNPAYRSLVGAEMPPNLPWVFIAASFVLIALVRLVHRHVMWEAVLPRLKFSRPRLATGPIHMTDEITDEVLESKQISIICIDISNSPRARVGGKAAEDAWATTIFENEITGQKTEVLYCRWEGNRKPRKDTEGTTRTPRYNQDWNVRTLGPNGMPHRLDFGIFFEKGGPLFGFNAYAQEQYLWAEPKLQLWQHVPIKVTVIVDATNLENPAEYTFRLTAGQSVCFL